MWDAALRVRRRLPAWPARTPRRPPRTLLDAGDAAAVVRLVRALDRGDGTDALADRLARLYAAFPPDEALLARLSLLQQAHAGAGTVEDFCATTAYALATGAVLQGHRAPAPLRRAHSHPALGLA